MRVVIFDPLTPKPYSLKTLKCEPLGGTEATVIRIAERLDAVVVQHNRSRNEGRYRTSHLSLDPTHLIVLRVPRLAVQQFQRYQKAQKFLWMHDLPGDDLKECGADLANLGTTIVCISDFQAMEVNRILSCLPENKRPNVKRIYYPVDVLNEDSASDFDKNKLIFFSSPHKGLQYALNVFSYLHRMNRELRLYVANPGYLIKTLAQQPGVINLGPVPHHVIMDHVRVALCTFYPNYVCPETFGLVLAESNALGTPVITHPIGAAPEVLLEREQFVQVPKARAVADKIFRYLPLLRNKGEHVLANSGCYQEYAEKVNAWQSGKRPRVLARPEFSISTVINCWRKLLEG
jgi:glycosyltransferase involved in cell wall biosynthesis